MVIAMVALILAVPVLAQETATDAVIEAQRQAEADFDRTMWLGVGCLLGLTGVLIAYLVEPSPSPMVLIGKSPEYVAVYTEIYRRKAKSLRTKYALYGCLGNVALSTVLLASR